MEKVIVIGAGILGASIANGLGASGLTSGPYLGAEIAKHVVGKQTEIDFGSYAISGALEIPSGE